MGSSSASESHGTHGRCKHSPQALRGLGDLATGSPRGNSGKVALGSLVSRGCVIPSWEERAQRPPSDVSIPLGRDDPRTHKLTTITSPQADEQTAAQLGEED